MREIEAIDTSYMTSYITIVTHASRLTCQTVHELVARLQKAFLDLFALRRTADLFPAGPSCQRRNVDQGHRLHYG